MKDRILNELRRIAKAQGGKAPGHRQFESETGISQSDWYGKLWAKWSDAIHEAGLSPNQFQQRIPDHEVVGQYADICRKIGHPPTSGELRMFLRKNDGYFSVNVFSSRYGGKNGLIAAVRDLAIQTDDSELEALLPDVKANDAPTSRNAQRADGHVYLLQSGDFYKIGRSDELERRVKEISVSLPDRTHLAHAITTDDPPGIEAYWHRRFADKRANGEWFKLSKDEVRAFKRRKFQ